MFSLALSSGVEVPDRYRAICGHGDDLLLIRTPADLLHGSRVSEAFTKEHKVVFSRHAVGKHFIRLSTESKEAARGTDFNVHNFVGVGDLSNGRLLITVPEEDGRTLSSCYEFELVVFALSHAVVDSVGGLTPVDSLFCF
jgi:hypothetical protein